MVRFSAFAKSVDPLALYGFTQRYRRHCFDLSSENCEPLGYVFQFGTWISNFGNVVCVTIVHTPALMA
ncbi:hypothetical protein D3C87_2156360 [compost metagenome]